MNDQLKKWGQLLLGIALIWGFIVIIVPLFMVNKQAEEVLNYIEERDIDTRALFYTESEEAVRAEFLMRQKVKKEN